MNRAEKETSSDEVPLPVAILSFILIVYSIIHTAQTRTINDFLTYPVYIAVPTAILAFASLLREIKRSIYSTSNLRSWMLYPLAIPAIAASSALYYSIAASLYDLYFYIISDQLAPKVAVAAAIGVTLVVSVILFYFRLKARSMYGVTEAAIGVTVVAHRVSVEGVASTQDPAFYLAMLTAGVYLVVRGLDNIHQGLTKDPKDPIAIKIVARFWPEHTTTNPQAENDKSAA